MAAYFAGFLFGSRVAESLIANVGHIRVFAGLASMASTAVLIHALFIDPVTWGLMRFVTGLCMAGLYVTEESWLNDLATNATRGRLLSRYMIVTMGGMTIGQFLLDVADPDGVKLFLLASVLVSASLIPVVLSASSNPPLVVPERMSLRELAASSRPASSPHSSAARRSGSSSDSAPCTPSRSTFPTPGSPPSWRRRCSARCCCSGRSVGSPIGRRVEA